MIIGIVIVSFIAYIYIKQKKEKLSFLEDDELMIDLWIIKN